MKQRVLVAFLGVFGLTLLNAAHAADAVRGKALFNNTNNAPLSCASAACHSGFPQVVRNNINKASNPSNILNAIASNKGGMGVLNGYVNSTDAADIAAYVANPSAANGAPAISLSAPSLTFAAQLLATTSAAQTVTVSNTGTAVLNITALTFSGTASAEYARSGTCQVGTSVAVGGNCTLQIRFTPAAVGARNATLTISHNATGGTSTVALTGTGMAAPAVASVTPTTLSFTQTLNTTSSAQAVTVRNTGGQALTLGAIGLSGVNAAEFALGAASTCANGTVLNSNATCTLQVTFTPTTAGARTATLSIAHSAAASPALVALSGTGTAVPQPAISLSATSLDFGPVSLGDKSAAQTVTLTNSGQAPLVLSNLTLGGATGGDFALSGSCASGLSLAPAANCTLQLTFAPAAVGSRSGTLTVTSNASNGNPVVALTGSGVQYSISVNPASATLTSQVGVTSPPVQVVVTNSAQSPITLSTISITGPFVLQQGSNPCGEGPIDLIPGQTCNLYVAFLPASMSSAAGEVSIDSASLKTPMKITLSGQATAQQAGSSPPSGSPPPGSPAPPEGSSAVAPSNTGGGCTVGPADQLLDPALAAMLGVGLFGVLRRRAASSTRPTRDCKRL